MRFVLACLIVAVCASFAHATNFAQAVCGHQQVQVVQQVVHPQFVQRQVVVQRQFVQQPVFVQRQVVVNRGFRSRAVVVNRGFRSNVVVVRNRGFVPFFGFGFGF